MQPIGIEKIIHMSEDELKKINFHCTSEENKDSIDKKGFEASIGENSEGIFGNQPYPEVFFSQGLEYFLQMVNRAMRLVMYAIENRTNEKGQKAMDTLKIKDHYKREEEKFDGVSEEQLQTESITPELKEALYAVVKKMFEDRVCYLLDIEGCTRDEYESLSLEEKRTKDYLSDDFNEEYFEKDKNGNRTIPNPDHLVSPSNMHTIKYQGVSAEQVHRIVNTDGSLINAFEVIMKLCEKYKELNHNSTLPLIINRDGSGDNWLEIFYGIWNGGRIEEPNGNKPGYEDVLSDDDVRIGTERDATRIIGNTVLDRDEAGKNNKGE